MKKKGFTLVELLGVIVVLGILVLIAFPPIINQIRNARDKVSEGTLKLLYSATEKYMDENNNTYPRIIDRSYCISLQTLVDDGKLTDPITDSQTGSDIPLTNKIVITVNASKVRSYSMVETCTYIDPTGANAPELVDGMIPIIRDAGNTKWLKADPTTDWYNYGAGNWANAVLVTDAARANAQSAPAGTEIYETNILMYYVWIPRFRYQLFNASFVSQTAQTINLIFEGKRDVKSGGVTNGTWLTHPAFTFGTIEVNGFWVAKFEAGYNGAASTIAAQVATPDINKLIVKPNSFSWRSIAVSNMHNVAQTTTIVGNVYGLNATADVHVMRSMEWGAIAYLTQSVYGKNDEVWINPADNYMTGCAGTTVSSAATVGCTNTYNTTNGLNASTTGNIYGVYDMAGCGWEYTTGVMYNSGNTTLMTQSSGFSQATIDSAAMNKYVNKYLYGTTTSDQAAYNRSQLGDGLGETRSWNSDSSVFINSIYSWSIRGGNYDSAAIGGVFSFHQDAGLAGPRRAFRPVIIKQ